MIPEIKMSESGHDIQVCLCKALKLLSQRCLTFTLKHPILSLSTLCMFLLYVAFPFAFWVLVYSVPLGVCTGILLILSFNTDRPTDSRQAQEATNGKNKRPITHVHSVRRRRAKEFANNTQQVAEDKPAVSTTDFNHDMVNEDTVIKEENSNIPKEIRQVEVVLVSSTKSSSKHEFDDSGKEDGNNQSNNKAAMLDNEEDDRQKNKMDVVISDSERTKRLKSLIARRREVRRSLMNKDITQDHQISSTKINNMSRLVIPSRVVGGGLRSPIPGSAPSVLRSPFDLPYDPQEEKPDLTGDSFEQDFMLFCRHESFSLRPGEFNRNLKEISLSVPDSRASCSMGHQLSIAGKELDTEFAPIINHKLSESTKPILHSPDEDHIKEIIPVHENSSEDNDINGEVRTIDALEEEDNSSQEDAPVFKIDRLKDQFYYTDKTTTTRRHTASNSIASDMQVEVSELSSPPLTIDENLSYDDNHDADSWAGSSHFDFSQMDDYESRLAQVDEISEQVGSSRVPEDTTMSNKSQCDHRWCSIAEYHTNCRTTRATNLDEKIDKTLKRSVSLLAQSSSRDDSMGPEECCHRLNKSEESNTLDAVTSSKILHEYNTNTVETTIDEVRKCHDMEHLVAQRITPSEDSQETRQPEHQENILAPSILEDHVQVNLGSTQHGESDQNPPEGTSIIRSALGSSSEYGEPSNLRPNSAFELVQSSPSPKSVLHPTCSLASFENYIDDEVNARADRVFSPVAHHDSADLLGIDGELEGLEKKYQQELSEPSNTSTTEVDYEESAKQGEIHESAVKPEEAPCCSSQVHSRYEEQAQTIQEISSTSFTVDACKENLTGFSHRTDHSNNSDPPLSSDEEEQSKRQEIGIA